MTPSRTDITKFRREHLATIRSEGTLARLYKRFAHYADDGRVMGWPAFEQSFRRDMDAVAARMRALGYAVPFVPMADLPTEQRKPNPAAVALTRPPRHPRYRTVEELLA